MHSPDSLEVSAGARPRVVFLGRKNPFNLGIIDWLAENLEVVGAYFVEPNRFSGRARLRRIVRRAKKWMAPSS